MRPQIAAFRRRWQIAELAQFGSAVRADFGAHSDVDLLFFSTRLLRGKLLELPFTADLR